MLMRTLTAASTAVWLLGANAAGQDAGVDDGPYERDRRVYGQDAPYESAPDATRDTGHSDYPYPQDDDGALTTEDPAPPYDIAFGGSLALVSFTDEFSALSGLGDTAFEASFEGAYFFTDFFAVEGGLGLLLVDDEDPFSVLVRDPVTGDIEEEETDQTGLSVFGGVRAQSRPVGGFSAFGVAGFKDLVFERTIRDCVDCPSESVEIDVGPYYGGGIIAGDTHQFELRFQAYDSADVNDQVLIGYRFRR